MTEDLYGKPPDIDALGLTCALALASARCPETPSDKKQVSADEATLSDESESVHRYALVIGDLDFGLELSIAVATAHGSPSCCRDLVAR